MATVIYAAVVSFMLLKVIDALMPLREQANVEQQGLDITQRGEKGYNP